MDFDELWLLYEELTTILAERIGAEKRKLEARLTRLSSAEQPGAPPNSPRDGGASRPRRKYPKVLPKYFNPSVPTQTWSGRGKQPRWIVAALKSGHKLEEFRISYSGASPGNKAQRRRS